MESELVRELIDDAGTRMGKSVDATRTEFSSVRTGRASPHLLDRVEVEYYGATTPLRQLANISASEARLLTVTPYDKGSIKQIEKAIMESDVGLTPNNDGSLIRLTIPELTEERRRELVKVVHGHAEDGRIVVRRARTDARDKLKKLQGTSEDDVKHAEKDLQKVHDDFIAQIDSMLKAKEVEIMSV